MVTELSALDAFNLVSINAGANRWRDPVDSIMLYQLSTIGRVGTQISDETSLNLPDVVGRIPTGTGPKDTDQDGMPDEWETLHSLNPDLPSDRNKTNLSIDGYTNLEMYLNELAGDKVAYKTVGKKQVINHHRNLSEHMQATVAWIDLNGNVLAKETQYLNSAIPRPFLPAHLHGVLIASITFNGNVKKNIKIVKLMNK